MSIRQFDKRILTAASLLAALGSPSCTTTINPNDSSPPVVEIKAKVGGQYQIVSQIDYLGEPIELMCLVTDPEGVKSLRLTFSGAASYCNVNGAVYSGSFQIKPLPDPLQQDLTKPLDRLPMLKTLVGPFTCKQLGGDAGTPYGQNITVWCQGTNWSNSSSNSIATKDLKVTIQSGS